RAHDAEARLERTNQRQVDDGKRNRLEAHGSPMVPASCICRLISPRDPETQRKTFWPGHREARCASRRSRGGDEIKRERASIGRKTGATFVRAGSHRLRDAPAPGQAFLISSLCVSAPLRENFLNLAGSSILASPWTFDTSPSRARSDSASRFWRS